jgi:hypothetical protein
MAPSNILNSDCGPYDQNANKSSHRNLKGSHLEDLGINRKIILECILNNFGFDSGLDSSGSNRF